jgi:regulator of nucleoside diphosphate kinase
MPTLENIVLTRQDYGRLKRLFGELSGAPAAATDALANLEEVLDVARLVEPTQIASNVVTMNSRVLFEDLRCGEQGAATLVYPAGADAASRRISVLSPVGTALLGEAEGAQVELPLPHGRTREIRIVRVLYQPEAEGDFDL